MFSRSTQARTSSNSVLLGFVFICFAGCETSVQLEPQPKKEAATTFASDSRGTPTDSLPSPPDGSLDWVFQPRVHTVFGSAKAGTCFAVRWEPSGDTFLLTAHSLIGREGGIYSDFRPARLGDAVLGIELHSLSDSEASTLVKIAPLVTLPSGWYEPAGDVAGLRVLEDADLPTGRLSTNRARKGDVAWLVAADARNDSPDVMYHPVTIEQTGDSKRNARFGRVSPASVNDELIAYRFADSTLPTYGLLGAPLVNQQGEVVGVHASAQRSNATLWGHAVPTTRFIGPLTDSIKREKPGPTIAVSGYTMNLPDGYTAVAGEKNVWRYQLADGRELRMTLQVGPNKRGFDTSDGTMRKLMHAGIDRLTGGRSGTRSANGEMIDRPGIRVVLGRFSIGTMSVFGRGAASGLLAVGVNSDHLVLASVTADGPLEGTPADILANRAFKTLIRVGAADESWRPDSLAPDRTVTIEILELEDNDYPNTIRGLLAMLERHQFRTMSVEATRLPLKMAIETTLTLPEVAQRIQLASKTSIDASRRKITVEVEPISRGAGVVPSVEQHVAVLEARDWRLDVSRSLEALIKTDPQDASSDEVRRRVAKQFAIILMDHAHWADHDDIIKAVAGWDADIGRQALVDKVAEGKWPLRAKALEALAPVADESVVETVADTLLHMQSGHAKDPSLVLFQMFPEKSEAVLLEKLADADYENTDFAKAGVQALAKFGGTKSLEALRELAADEENSDYRKSLLQSVSQLEKRLN